MKRNISLWQLCGFAFVSLFGTLLHFLYEWTGESVLTALFSAVNESTWEHMKLVFFPMLAFAVVQRRFFREYKNFWCVKLFGILTGLILIPVLFYTYNGAVGKSPDLLNIAFFFISTATAFVFETYLLKKGVPHCKRPYSAFALICLIGILFVIFTFITPQIPLFRDPLTGEYGIKVCMLNPV